jgi:DNA-binding GntR family transcriptional regulator
VTSSRRTIEPLVRESTPGIIADKLRTAIGRGDFKAGDQLGEAQLARELGISRGPLREGMQRLTQEGLLVSVRNRGLFVVEMTPENVRDMYVARAAIERAAAEQIFGHDPQDAGDQLLAVTGQMAQAASREDDPKVSEADIDFHQMLVSLSRSPMCIHALEQTYRHSDDRVAEHRGIAEAFVALDPALTDARLVAHMEDAVVRLATGAPRRTTPSQPTPA